MLRITERYNVDIRCYRLALAKNGNDDFLTCTRAYPPPELTDVAIRRRRKKEVGDADPTSWDEKIGLIENQAETDFLRKEIVKGQENNAVRSTITFRIGEKRRYRIYSKKQFAFVVQTGRFDDDIAFWKSLISDNASVKTRHNGNNLRFRLRTAEDFDRFRKVWDNELKTKNFMTPSNQGAEENEDETETDE